MHITCSFRDKFDFLSPNDKTFVTFLAYFRHLFLFQKMLKKLEYVCDTDSRFFVEKANDRDKLFQPVHLEGKQIIFYVFYCHVYA